MDITALFDISYGVYVVSALDGERPVGCLVNTVVQLTAEPVTLAVSVSKENYTEGCMRQCGQFSISTLSENTPQEVIGLFGFQSSREVDKFENLQYHMEDGLPVLDEKACSFYTCKIRKEVDMDTHVLFIGDVVSAERLSKEPPMTYDYYHKVIKGKASKNAPTYVKDELLPETKSEQQYVCDVCGYRYPGTPEEFEALPDSWVCPLCGVDKSHFTLRA